MQEQQPGNVSSPEGRKAGAADSNTGTGLPQGEQGQASYGTGSTTQGGSNYGQGSSHLGGESHQQGSQSNAGASYTNESGRLGASSTGTPDEGSQSPNAGDLSQFDAVNAPDEIETVSQGTGTQPYHNSKAESDTNADRGVGMTEEDVTDRNPDRPAGSWNQSSVDQ